jgi:hypothetical protein
MRPKVLLATTCRWFAVARLAMSLKKAGFLVEVVCPKDHPVSKISSVLRIHRYRALFPIASIKAAISAAEPAVVIPCDDLARVYLHTLYRRERRKSGSAGSIATLLVRSLGDPASYPTVVARSGMITLAEAEGIRVPATAIVRDQEEMRSWLHEHGLPAAIKTDGTSGGVGVTLVYTLDEANRAFAALHAPPLLARTAKRALIDQDLNLILPFLVRRRPLVNVQSLIRGHDATSSVACWQGKVIASIGFDVVHTWKPKGPASVVKLNENPEMIAAAEKIVSRLKLSGLYGFDFMIEEETGHPYLIEMNPRATQTAHLPLGSGRDLPAALWTAISGELAQETESVTRNNVIALFPHEWQRNPASSFLLTAYHDVPWEEPELVRECIESPPQGGAWSLEALAQVSSKLPWPR